MGSNKVQLPAAAFFAPLPARFETDLQVRTDKTEHRLGQLDEAVGNASKPILDKGPSGGFASATLRTTVGSRSTQVLASNGLSWRETSLSL